MLKFLVSRYEYKNKLVDMMKQPKGFINFFRLLLFCYKNLTKIFFCDSINIFK